MVFPTFVQGRVVVVPPRGQERIAYSRGVKTPARGQKTAHQVFFSALEMIWENIQHFAFMYFVGRSLVNSLHKPGRRIPCSLWLTWYKAKVSWTSHWNDNGSLWVAIHLWYSFSLHSECPLSQLRSLSGNVMAPPLSNLAVGSLTRMSFPKERKSM